MAFEDAFRFILRHAWVKWTLIAIMGITGLAIVGSILPDQGNSNRGSLATVGQRLTLDSRGVALAKLLLLDDFNGYLVGKRVVGDWSAFQPIDARATAEQLYVAYNENEVAADEKFKDKTLAVTGVVTKIGKDVFDNTYLLLESGGLITKVQAFLAEETVAVADRLRPGESIVLVCQGNGVILGSPILKGCQASDVLSELKKAQIDALVDDVLANGGQDGVAQRLKQLVGYAYVVGVALPKGDACETARTDNMADCVHAMHTISKPEREARYGELAKQISLPPLHDK